MSIAAPPQPLLTHGCVTLCEGYACLWACRRNPYAELSYPARDCAVSFVPGGPRVLIGHDRARELARAGDGLTWVRADQHGLRVELCLPDTTIGRYVSDRLPRCFRAWSIRSDQECRESDGRVTRLRVIEVSLVRSGRLGAWETVFDTYSLSPRMWDQYRSLREIPTWQPMPLT